MPDSFVTKPLDMIQEECDEVGEHTLKRALGPTNLIALGIGAIIGTGIFVLTGSVAALNSGPAGRCWRITTRRSPISSSSNALGMIRRNFAGRAPVAILRARPGLRLDLLNRV